MKITSPSRVDLLREMQEAFPSFSPAFWKALKRLGACDLVAVRSALDIRFQDGVQHGQSLEIESRAGRRKANGAAARETECEDETRS